VQVTDKMQEHNFHTLLLDAQSVPTEYRHQESAIQLFAPYMRQYCINNLGRPLRNECLEAVYSIQQRAAFAALQRM
jgi:hypothetical protein